MNLFGEAMSRVAASICHVFSGTSNFCVNEYSKDSVAPTLL